MAAQKRIGLYMLGTMDGPRPDWGKIGRHARKRTGYNGRFGKELLQGLADELKKDYDRIQKLADDWKEEVSP